MTFFYQSGFNHGSNTYFADAASAKDWFARNESNFVSVGLFAGNFRDLKLCSPSSIADLFCNLSAILRITERTRDAELRSTSALVWFGGVPLATPMEMQSFPTQPRETSLAQARMHNEIAKAQLSSGDAQLGLANAVRAYILALKLGDACNVLSDAQFVVCRHLCHHNTPPDYAGWVYAAFKTDLAETRLAAVFFSSDVDLLPTLLKECIDLATDALLVADIRLCIAGMWHRRGWPGDFGPSLRMACDAFVAAGDLAGQAHCAHVVAIAQWGELTKRKPSQPARQRTFHELARTLLLLENSATLYEACCMAAPAAAVLCRLAWWYVEMSSVCVGGVPVDQVQVSMARCAIRSAQRAHALCSKPAANGASLAAAKHVWGCAHYVLACAPSMTVVERALHWRVAIMCMEEALGCVGRGLEEPGQMRESRARGGARCCMDVLMVLGERGSTSEAPYPIPGTELSETHHARLLAWTDSVGAACVGVLEASTECGPDAVRYKEALAKKRSGIKPQEVKVNVQSKG